jgi:chemotaxis protein MotB
MKHSRGNLIVTFLPILILASIAAVGWYYYYSEVNKYQSLTMDSRSEQEKLNNKLENLQTTINKLLEDETALQARLVSEKKSQQELQTTINKLQEEEIVLQARLMTEEKSQQELQSTIDKLQEEEAALKARLVSGEKAQQEQTALLEKILTEKKVMEAEMQQEVNKYTLTTAELEAELENRRLAQKSLNDKISTVSGERSKLLTQLEQEQESKNQIANLKSRLEQELDESRVEISHLKNQMTVIKLTSEILFDSGSAEIKPAGQKVLSIIADSLNAYPGRAISVEGHTDNVPVLNKDRYESNWELSAARALAAVKFFQQSNQVDPTRLRVVGHGEYHPVSSNETAEGRKLNRRIEIRLLAPEIAGVSQNQQTQ